jgi:hypothetical protein
MLEVIGRLPMIIIALALAFAAASTGEAAESTSQAQTPPTQELFLRVSTHSGPLPLALDLKGELRGIDPAEYQSCSIRVDRTYVTPSGMKLEERAEHPCVAAANSETPSPIPAKFERELVLQEPGDYLLRIMLQPKDGKPIAGMTHPVKVYKAPWAVGVKAATTD